ncbi:MAG: PD-(D/E)XK nuclease family protein [Actinobacteria bacterium]|nr:PD-(D/E)XK nuclease family protein [Actinomycetota bacterium]
MNGAALTLAQRRVTEDLMALGQPRPHFDPAAATDLRARTEEALAPLAEALAPDVLWLAKSGLAQVHACEAHYLAELGPLGPWSVAMAEGEVTHRAIQLSIAVDDTPMPLELVDHAMAQLAADEAGPLGSFLATLLPAGRAELRAGAANGVATFLECWPPISPAWWPRTELRVRADLCGGRVVLQGKIDLALGRAVGTEARCLFVDLKTGGRYPAHLDDLRFYALVQAIRIGVPPFRVASYYLDSASFHAEDVTPDTLEVALRRTLDGARKMAELRSGQRQAEVTPCPRCRYCRARSTCPGAGVWEERRQAEAGELA